MLRILMLPFKVLWLPFKVLTAICAFVGFAVLLVTGLLLFKVVDVSDIPFSSNLGRYLIGSNISSGGDTSSLTVGQAVDAAIDKVGDLVDAVPVDATTLSIRGKAYYKAGKYDAAIADFSELVQLDGNNKEAIMYLGHSVLAKGDAAGAINYYDIALQGLTDTDMAAEIYLHRGQALQRQGNIEDAVHAYDQALIVKPDYEEAKEAKAAIGG